MAPKASGRKPQSGVTTVEFAVIGAVFFMVLFGVIEFGRALFVVNSLTEATRRGARMAAVCPVGDPKPASVAVFAAGGSNSTVVYGLNTGNIVVEYLDQNGAVLANPATSFGLIHYVSVRVTGFAMPLMIPLVFPTLTLNGFKTILPRESLGVPRSGAIEPC